VAAVARPGARAAVGMRADRRPVQRRRVLLYSHDTYGLGHLRRNLRIAGHLLETDPSLRIVLMSGSPVSEKFPIPDRLRVVKLPPVTKVGPDCYRPLNRNLSIGEVSRARTTLMSSVVRHFRPDALLVDHSPAGMHGELLGVFETVREHAPQTRLVLGLRDVLDEPAAVTRDWRAKGIYELIERVYDRVLVYGSQDVFDIGQAYQLPRSIRDRLMYCGYLHPDRARPADVGSSSAARIHREHVLATAGGGGDGLQVLVAAIEAGVMLGLPTVVVGGPLMDAEQFAVLRSLVHDHDSVELLRFHPDVQTAMAAARLIVTMGGYNTLTEAVASRTPTIVVPRRHPRLEQTIRAELFARRGLVRAVEHGPDLGQRIAQAAAAFPRAIGRAGALDFDGLSRLADILSTLIGSRDYRDPGPVAADSRIVTLARRPA